MSTDGHAEEQEMEAEALEAIFASHFMRSAANEWTIDLYPNIADGEVNYVGCQLIATLPSEYPTELPQFSVRVLQGLAEDEHGKLLQALADDEAQANEGVPNIFAVCERLREWLVENNVKGLDDQSMHAQMLRKKQLQSKQSEPSREFEAQTVSEVFTEAELEEIEVRKRRDEGTPCNKENFEAWKARFEAEMAQSRALAEDADEAKKNKQKKEDRANRLTGYQQFAANMNLEALEAAAEQAEVDDDDEGNLDEVDEELFQEDVDLDDLDFDSDEDEDDVDI